MTTTLEWWETSADCVMAPTKETKET